MLGASRDAPAVDAAGGNVAGTRDGDVAIGGGIDRVGAVARRLEKRGGVPDLNRPIRGPGQGQDCIRARSISRDRAGVGHLYAAAGRLRVDAVGEVTACGNVAAAVNRDAAGRGRRIDAVGIDSVREELPVVFDRGAASARHRDGPAAVA